MFERRSFPNRWEGRMEPFKIISNVYFVGCFPASTHLIDTGDGLILIDPGYTDTLHLVVDGIYKLGFRPEDTAVGDHFEMKVTANENLGMNTLVHGHIGRDGKGERITCKLNGWCNYKPGDVVGISIVRRHFFDKETTNAIRMEE